VDVEDEMMNCCDIIFWFVVIFIVLQLASFFYATETSCIEKCCAVNIRQVLGWCGIFYKRIDCCGG
jgi:hypothetical protein